MSDGTTLDATMGSTVISAVGDGTVTGAINSLNNSLDGFRFGIDDDGNYGYYKIGADTVTPFKSSSSADLLWTNSDITSAFSAQTISLDLSTYEAVLIDFWGSTSSSYHYITSTEYAKIGETRVAGLSALDYNHSIRTFTVSETGITFANAYIKDKTQNVTILPYHIYGVSKSLL